jgi:23S rRNA pseudouridine2605 synthase
MNPNDADSLPPDPTIVDAPPADDAPAAEAAPKRKRAVRKKALLSRAPEAHEVFGTPTPAEAPAAEAAAATAAPAPEPLNLPIATPPAQPAAAPVPAAVVPRAAETAAETPVPTAALDAAAPAEAGEGGEAAAAAVEGAAAEGPKRSRNRRRGRRGGDRGDRPPRSDAPPAEGDTEPAEAGDAGEADEPREPSGTQAAEPAAPKPPPVDVGELFAQVLSGAFDVEPAEDETVVQPPKRVLAAEPDAPKLHKVLAQAGVGSRRDMEQMIVEGRITVNGAPAHIGQRISFGDRIAVGGKPVRVRIAPPPPRVLAYHKPAGEVVTHDDPQQRPTVFRRLPRLQQGKWQSVGRLDINTEGLLLFTNSGELANQLMHPRFGVEREYAVRSLGVLGEEAKGKLLEGVDIDGQRCAFKSIEDGGGEGVNHWYRCVITEGRNREVRKLFETVGHAVSRLIRIRYGSVVLPRGLKRGVWTDLDDMDVRSLRRIAGGPERGAERGAERDGEHRNRRGGKGAGRNTPPDRGGRGARGPRPDGGDRIERPDRPERVDRLDRPDRPERAERGEGGAIPNPLQQTYDRRAIQQERALRRDMPEDGPIPNPLQQTYDKRALQRDRAVVRDVPEDGPIPNPLQQTYDKRFAQSPRGPGGGGARGGGAGRAKKGGGEGSARQPDPLKTAVGYIGGDAFLRKANGGGGRGGSRGGRSGGGGGGGGNRGGRR